MTLKGNFIQGRVGEIHKLKSGATVEIIEYKGVDNVDIKVLDHGEIKRGVRYGHIKEGIIKLKYFPIIYGLGYIGEEVNKVNYSSDKPYKVWKSMMQRCYDKALELKYPSYIRAVVCEEWYNYTNFKTWYDENYYEIKGESMCLDKDILIKGNKIYSPETCVFAPERINYLFVNSLKPNRSGIIGVKYNLKRKKYEVSSRRVNVGIKTVYKISHRYFPTEIEAFLYFKQERENSIKAIANEYKDKIPGNLYVALCNWRVEIDD